MAKLEGKPGVSSAGIIEMSEYRNDGLVIAQLLVNIDNLVPVRVANTTEHKMYVPLIYEFIDVTILSLFQTNQIIYSCWSFGI